MMIFDGPTVSAKSAFVWWFLHPQEHQPNLPGQPRGRPPPNPPSPALKPLWFCEEKGTEGTTMLELTQGSSDITKVAELELVYLSSGGDWPLVSISTLQAEPTCSADFRLADAAASGISSTPQGGIVPEESR